jgi:hypothetical protein
MPERPRPGCAAFCDWSTVADAVKPVPTSKDRKSMDAASNFTLMTPEQDSIQACLIGLEVSSSAREQGAL